MDEYKPLMPDNHMALAIVTTVCCCLPLGIVAILKANNVNTLYALGQYDAAVNASEEANKWSYIGIGLAVVGWILYIVFWGGLAVIGGLMETIQ